MCESILFVFLFIFLSVPETQGIPSRCLEPVRPGPCAMVIPRFFYNASSEQCHKFIWGGCMANGNNFVTLEDCSTTCVDVVVEDPCLDPPISGPCKGLFPRWYYESQNGTCALFVWGGCQPQSNNFDKELNCQKTCSNHICSQPTKVGPCMALIPRYTFNTTSGVCEPFLWGGCEPNGNNFEVVDVCKDVCQN